MTLGDGANQITVDNSTAANITSGNGNNTLKLTGFSTANGIKLGTGNNTLTLSDNAHISSLVAGAGGNNTVTVKDNATFGTLDAGTGGVSNSLTFDNTNYTLVNASDVQHFDELNLVNGSDFTSSQVIQMGDTDSSAGRIAIDGSSSLVLTNSGAYNLYHALSGTGLIDVQQGTVFNFGVDTGNQFAGTVQMNSNDFALSGFNTTALTKAMLSVMGNNTTTVGGGVQHIGGLTFAGGTVDFGTNIPGDVVSANSIKADKLDVSGNGTVKVKHSSLNNYEVASAVGQNQGLLDQQNDTLVQLVDSTNVTGSAGNIVLKDENGNVISNATQTVINQDGVHAADGYYDYRLTTKNKDANTGGLYVGYGLTRLDLLTHSAQELVINTAHSSEKVLSAQVTGSGDLGIKAGNDADALMLSNLANSYTGVTDVQAGTVKLGTDNGFGATSKLALANATTADINGKTQTIGSLAGQLGSRLNLNNGKLTISNGGTSSGVLTGSGELTLSSGVLTVNNANADLSAKITVDAGVESLLKDVLALGTGHIIADGLVTLDNTSGTFANVVSGNGQLNYHNGSNVSLTGDNTNFNGVMDIDSNSTLIVSEGEHVGGSTAINNANELIVNNDSAMTLAAIVNGTGDLIKMNTGTLTLSGTNIYTGKTDIQGGTLAISDDANLGDSGNKTLLNGGDLEITADLTSNRDVTLVRNGSVKVDSEVTASMNGWKDQTAGAGAITKDGGGLLIWTGNNSANTAQVNVNSGTLQVEGLDNLASADGVVNLGASGVLSILKDSSVAADIDFTRQLSGTGELLVNLGNKNQSLTLNGSSTGGNFEGKVTIDQGRFVLDVNSDTTLANGKLQLNNGGSTKLDGSHFIGGLTMNGGRLDVGYDSQTNRPQGVLTVNDLDVTGGGSIAVTTPNNLPNPMPITGSSLFDQDDGILDIIVKANGKVKGDGSQISITDENGTLLATDTVVGLVQGGVTAGNAHYNYAGSVKEDGIYLGYGLTQIDAFAGQSVILDNTNAVDNALGVKLTGSGGFTINTNGTVRIGNANSDYTGVTDLNSGNVELITDNGLGKTSQLNMQNGTSLDLKGNKQTLGSLNGNAGSSINFNGGDLTINNGGQTDGALTGEGKLILAGGTLNLTQNNYGFKGAADILSGATASLTKPQGLGQGVINNAGTLNLNSAKGALFNSLKGNGNTTLTNGAEIFLGGDNTDYSGSFTTMRGTTLTASDKAHLGTSSVDNSGTFSIDNTGLWKLDNTMSGNGTFVKKGTGTVQLESNNVSAGLTDIQNGLLLIGESATSTTANLGSDIIIGTDGAMAGYGKVTGNVTSSGKLIVGNAATGAGHGVFTIDGNYTGTDTSSLYFSTVLGNDSSATDRLNITGDTSGTGKVYVANARGEGAQTVDGIKLIDVGGHSDAKFTLGGRAVAGAYEYFLYQGGVSTPTDGNWYLRSSNTPTLRPEVGGYMANMSAASKLFNLKLEDREGRAENSSMWLRQVGARNHNRDSSGQLQTQANSYVIQGGGEVFGTQFTEADRLGLGVMAAYGESHGTTSSNITGYDTKSHVDGYSVGGYGTWYQDSTTLNGLYVDSWVQYSWLNAEVTGQGAVSESYDIEGLSASIETGYRMPVYEGENGNIFVTPQGQITWSGIKADDHKERGGTEVSSIGHNNIQTRLGIKLSRDGVSDEDKGAGKLFTVYAEANWLYNTKQAGAKLDGAEFKQAGNRNIGELKIGVEGKLNSDLNLWGNVVQQVGGNGYYNTALTFGVKIEF